MNTNTFPRLRCTNGCLLAEDAIEVIREDYRTVVGLGCCPKCNLAWVDYGKWFDQPQPCPGVECIVPGHARSPRPHNREVMLVGAYSRVGVKGVVGKTACNARCMNSQKLECKCRCGGEKHGL